jgi:hypothetical protein
MKLVRLSRATIYRLERAGLFPKRVQITDNTVGWHDARGTCVEDESAAGAMSDANDE